jgi:hypothetical protein
MSDRNKAYVLAVMAFGLLMVFGFAMPVLTANTHWWLGDRGIEGDLTVTGAINGGSFSADDISWDITNTATLTVGGTFIVNGISDMDTTYTGYLYGNNLEVGTSINSNFIFTDATEDMIFRLATVPGYQWEFWTPGGNVVAYVDVNTGDTATGMIRVIGPVSTGLGDTTDQQLVAQYIVGDTINYRYYDDVWGLRALAAGDSRGMVISSGGTYGFGYGMHGAEEVGIYALTSGSTSDAYLWLGYSPTMTALDNAMSGFFLNYDGATADLRVHYWHQSLATNVTLMTFGCTTAGAGSCSDIVMDLQATIDPNDGDTAILVAGATAMTITPGSDKDATLLEVGVTGTPTMIWDESDDELETDRIVAMQASDGNGALFRHYSASAGAVSPGGSGATLTDANNVIYYELDANTEYLYFNVDVGGWDGNSDIVVEIYVALHSGETADEDINAELSCDYMGDHEDIDTSYKTQTRTINHDIGSYIAAGTIHKLTFVLNEDLASNNIDNGDILACSFRLDDVSAPATMVEDIRFLHVDYIWRTAYAHTAYPGTMPTEP